MIFDEANHLVNPAVNSSKSDELSIMNEHILNIFVYLQRKSITS